MILLLWMNFIMLRHRLIIALLEFYNPTILLGLTATPERMDNENILTYFDDVSHQK